MTPVALPENHEEWRGHVSAKVLEFDDRLKEHSADIRELRAGQGAMAVEMAKLKGEVQGLRRDLGDAVRQLNEARKQETEELKIALASRTLTFREKVLFIGVPLFVAIGSMAAIIWSAAKH